MKFFLFTVGRNHAVKSGRIFSRTLWLLLLVANLAEATFGGSYTWTQVTRWREEITTMTPTRKIYPETIFPVKGYDSRPHQQLRTMFPLALVSGGNNTETSDNLWDEVLASPLVLGNSTTLTRARDLVEDHQVNFIDPANLLRNFYFEFYTDNSTAYVSSTTYPRVLVDGPNAGQSVLGSNRLLAMGDDHMLWLDTDNTLSLYNYVGGKVTYNRTQTAFSGGPWAGQTLVSRLGLMIGYEQSNLYFLDGDNTVVIYNNSLSYVRTDEFRFDGTLFGSTLGDLVDGNIPGAHYVGWSLGPIVAFTHPDYNGNPQVPNNDYQWTHTARWMEDARQDDGPVTYRQDTSGNYDIRPHQQLWSMFPDAVVGSGNNKETSDALWAEILQSDYLIGNSSSLVRAHDPIEDWHFNFINPANSTYNFYFYTYLDYSSLQLARTSFPLVLQNGINSGENLINNNRLLAVGDDNTLWLDPDNTLSIYGYPGATLRVELTKTQFTQDPADWLGAYLVDKLQYFIGYEEPRLYFLVGDSTLHIFDYNLSYLGTDEVVLDGDLAGITLGDIVDRKVSGVTYGGWNHGPTIVMVDTSVPAAPDHVELSYTDAGMTCNPHEVIIRACLDVDCSALFTDSVTVTMSPTGWIGGDTITFSGGSTTVQLSHTTPETISLGVLSSTPATTGLPTQCRRNGGAASAFCDLTFIDSGFVFTVPDAPANKPRDNVLVKAVRKDDATKQCVPGFESVSKTLKLWQTHVVPDSGSRIVEVNGAVVGTDEASATTQVFNFDVNGEATINVNYSDAGLTQLNLRYEGSGVDDGLVMTGYHQFHSYPVGLCASTASVCSGGAGCDPFIAAGDAFNITVSAMAWESDSDTDICDNPVTTPNYADSGLAITSTKLSPAGGSNGVITPTSYNHVLSADGTNTFSMTESEVGVFSFTVDPPEYLGFELGTATTAAVGRFYPHHFDVALVDDGEIDAACSAGTPDFTYTGQVMNWLAAPRFTLTAKNADNGTTQNYTQAGYMKLAAGDVTVDAPLADNTSAGTDANPMPVSVVTGTGTLQANLPLDGSMTYTLSSLDQVSYNRSTLAEVDPFSPDLTWTVSAASDSDGASLSAPLDLTPLADFDIRFGRLWLENTYGPDDADLYMPLRAEYFSGGRYRMNTADSCTVWNSAGASVLPATLTAIGASSGTLSSGGSGNSGILLLAPNSVAGTPDTGDATVTYPAPSWLQGDYDGNGSFEDPRGVATFGVYRGHQRLIYQREIR